MQQKHITGTANLTTYLQDLGISATDVSVYLDTFLTKTFDGIRNVILSDQQLIAAGLA